jgi:hypothetical protein
MMGVKNWTRLAFYIYSTILSILLYTFKTTSCCSAIPKITLLCNSETDTVLPPQCMHAEQLKCKLTLQKEIRKAATVKYFQSDHFSLSHFQGHLL